MLTASPYLSHPSFTVLDLPRRRHPADPKPPRILQGEVRRRRVSDPHLPHPSQGHGRLGSRISKLVDPLRRVHLLYRIELSRPSRLGHPSGLCFAPACLTWFSSVASLIYALILRNRFKELPPDLSLISSRLFPSPYVLGFITSCRSTIYCTFPYSCTYPMDPSCCCILS
jgi:hypothetical protein